MTETTTVSGHIDTLKENQENNYWGVQLEGSDEWHNANGSAPEELEEFVEVELEVLQDDGEFIDIQDWSIADNNDSGGGDSPVFRNSNLGVAAWVNEDKNGDYYLSVDVSLLDKFQIFPSDDIRDAFNQFAEHIQQDGSGGGSQQ